MWFKNLTLFRFSEPFPLSAEQLAEALGRVPFRPCGSQDMVSYGWVPPLGREAVEPVHGVGGCLLICLQAEDKLLPAGVVREEVERRARDIEAREDRKLRRKEKDTLRDEVMQELLPRAFTRTRQTQAYLNPADGWLVVDAASRKTVDEFTGLLRKTLGSLPIVPPRVERAPAAVMTTWLTAGELPPDLELEDQCELRDSADEGGVVRCQGQDLAGEEIQAHLAAGKEATRLALTWDGRLSLVLCEDLTVRRLRFLEVVQESLQDLNAETVEQVNDAEFALMTGELGRLLPRLLAFFGGEARTEARTAAAAEA